MSTLLYVNPDTKSVFGTAQGGSFTFPALAAGETLSYGLRFLQADENGNVSPSYPAVKSLKASLGVIDQRPVSGCTQLQIGTGASTSANTTVMLSWNASGIAIQNAINALAAVVATYGAATVREVPGGYTIVFANATAAVPIQASNNTMQPISMVQVMASQLGNEWLHEVRFTQVPLTSTSVFSLVNPPGPSMLEIRQGGTSSNGLYEWTEIQQLTVPANFAGTWYFTWNNGKTTDLDISDDATTIEAALNTLFAPAGGTCNVTNPTDSTAIIEFTGSFVGEPVALLGIVVDSSPPGDPTFALNLDMATVYAALRSAISVSVNLEVTAWISAPGLPDDDPGLPVLLFRTPVNVTRNVSEPGQETAQNADWLLPPSPIAYMPFGNNNVISGQQFYVTTLGDGAHTTFAVEHNLNTESIANIILRENIDGGRVLVLGTDYTAVVTNANIVTVTFPSAPTAAQYAVVITTAGPVAAFIAGLTVTIAQVTGLQDQLNSMGATLSELAALLPQTGPGASSNTTGTAWSVTLPATQKVMFLKSVPASLFNGAAITASALPAGKPPYMLPAILQSSSTTLPGTLPTPGTGNAGSLWQNDGSSPVLIPGGGQIGSGWCPPGGFIGSDGRMLYPLRQDGTGTNSYFPGPFEQELFTLGINDRMLRVGQAFEVDFGLIFQLINAGSKAQWVVRVYLGAIEYDTSPSPLAWNLKEVAWAATPALQQRVILTDMPEQHYFGLRIARAAPTDSLPSGMTCDQNLYGTWIGNNANAPASANFALKAVLENFDTEDTNTWARGWVSYQLIGGATTTNGNISTTPAQAFIS